MIIMRKKMDKYYGNVIVLTSQVLEMNSNEQNINIMYRIKLDKQCEQNNM